MDTSQLKSGRNKEIRDLQLALDEQKNLNKILIESQSIQNAILEKSLVGYYVLLNRRFYAMNSIAVEYTGYNLSELIGQKSDFVIHPDDKKEVRKKAQAMLKGELKSPHEFRIITKTNDIRWVIEVVAPIIVTGRRAVLGNAMDITQQKKYEQEMIELGNFYRTIFETTGTMANIVDEQGVITLVNSEWERQTGYRKEEWEGKRKWTEMIDKRDLPMMKEYFRLRRIDPQSVPRMYECRIIDSWGRTRTYFSNVSIIPGTKTHFSSAVDITESKEKEKELIRKTENLAELNTALAVLLKQREKDKLELETTLLSNIKELVLPYIERIKKSNLDKKHLAYVDLLESNLESIIAPFARKLSAKFNQLTPKEIQVASFIKDGKSSKEIASLMNISSGSVDIHRYRIRMKLGLNNTKANLQSYLLNLS